MSDSDPCPKTVYLITVGDPDSNGVMSDDFIETLILVGRLIERFHKDETYKDTYIYIEELILSDDDSGNYVKQDGLFKDRYLISGD